MGIRNTLINFYFDRFDISRKTKSTNLDGSTSFTTTPIQDFQNIPCRISYKTIDNPDNTDSDKNPKVLALEIFTDPNIKIKKGDIITAHKRDIKSSISDLATFTGIANEPNVYFSHQEIIVIVKGNA